jgi:transcriptional regulator with XRE-family HTH domain
MSASEFRSLRTKLGHTQRELSDALDLSVVQISRYENGHAPVPTVVRVALTALTRKPTQL